MKTRIDHATIITCRDGEPVVLDDASVTFDGGVITYVGPTADIEPAAFRKPDGMPPLNELRGRPLGAILIAMDRITKPQLIEALDLQKMTHGVIGQTLVDLGYVTEADVEWALAAQAKRELAPAGRELAPAGREPAPGACAVIDGRRKLVIPGLINTHHHLFQSLTRGLPAAQNAGLFDWLVTLYPLWRELTSEALRQAAAISIAELLLGGCTTTSDHLYLFPAERDVRIEAVLEAAESLGIRIHAGRGSMSLGSSAGGLPPDNCVQGEDEILADCRRVIEQFHDPRPMAMRRIDLAPCTPFSITPALLEQTRELAAEHDLLLHTHIAETIDEQRYCLQRFGVRPIAYLHRHGWLAPNVYLAHCVHLNEDEIRLLAETSTGVAHCPCSNMRLGSGIAPVRQMLEMGVKVGLGVDGSSSNDGGSLLAETRQALLLQRVACGSGDGRSESILSPADAFRMATVGGAAVLHRPELGRLEPGCAADLALYDADDVAFAGAITQDPLAAVILGQAPRPERVIVAGRTVVDAGRVVRLEMPQAVADFNRMVRERFRPPHA